MSQTPEIKEYMIGGLSLLASPKDLTSLNLRRRNDVALDQLLRVFIDPKQRERMFQEMWAIFDAQCEYKFRNRGSPYFAIFGTRGLGKSEVAAAVMERCRDIFEMILGIRPIPGFGRNPSDINELLAKATIRDLPAVIIGDETESETGQGRNTEEGALLDNLETIRVLQHTVIRCANRFQRLKTFSYYCDFVFEVIFSDRINRVNYCIMYAIDEEVEVNDGRVPIGIINVPMHTNGKLREIYEDMKDKQQKQFTSSGGRRSRLRTKLQPIVDALVDWVRNNKSEAGRITRPKHLRRILIFKVDRGDKWNLSEQELICDEAFATLKGELTQTGGSAPRGSAQIPVKIAVNTTFEDIFAGKTDELRDAVFNRLVGRGNDPFKVQALKIACERHISQAEVALMLERKQPAISGYMREQTTEHPVFNTSELGLSFEDVYSAMQTKEGIPHEAGGGYTDRPDNVVFQNDSVTPKEVLSLKCYAQKDDAYSIARNKLGKKEIEFAKEHNVPLYLVYYDIWHNKIHRVLDEDQTSFNFAC